MSEYPHPPWVAQERYVDIWKVLDANDWLIVDDVSEDAARLIAAAPELLEAAQKVCEYRSAVFIEHFFPFEQALLALSDAVEKAEGKDK